MSTLVSTQYQAPNPNPIIDLKGIYTKGVTVPVGYELTGEFRPPISEELFIPAFSICDVARAVRNYEIGSPRLILRKLKSKMVVTFRPIGENRLPKKDEWYAMNDQFYKAGADHTESIDSSRDIYTRTETEE